MQALTQYDSDSGSDAPLLEAKVKPLSVAINSAPGVELQLSAGNFIGADTKEVFHNPTADFFQTPVEGPFKKGQTQNLPQKTCFTGWVEEHNMDNFAFEEQYHTFQNYGYAVDPSTDNVSAGGVQNYVGDATQFNARKGATIFTGGRPSKKARIEMGDVTDLDGWSGTWSHDGDGHAFDKEQFDLQQAANKQRWIELKKLEAAEKEGRVDDDDDEWESSEFHGASLTDYQGRSYMYCPPEQRPAQTIDGDDDAIYDKKCYIPKRCVHTWRDHEAQVNCIRFLPGSGHLLLSASMDKTVKLFDTNTHRRCLRTFSGHEMGVRDLCFTKDGSRFLSTAYDKYIKLWDTETGQCISKHTNGKMAFCGKLYPENENEFLAGMKNKLIVQWDMRANEVVQKYDDHISAVNSVTYIDDNRRFVSAGDDGKLLIWEYGIPVVVQHIAEPHMHAVQQMTVSPDGKWAAGNSADNQVVVHSADGQFRRNHKKRFKNHVVAGNSVQVNWSSNMQFIMSGDVTGQLWIWDWQKNRVMKKLKAHEKVVTGCAWHPVEESKVATCSWDGTIKYWD